MTTFYPTDTMSFDRGQKLRHGAVIFEITDVKGSSLTLTRLSDGETKVISLDNLKHEYFANRLIPYDQGSLISATGVPAELEEIRIELAIPVTVLSPAALDNGLRKIRYIRALQFLGHQRLRPTEDIEYDLRNLATKYDDKKPPSAWTLYTCALQIERANGDFRAAFPKFKDRGGRSKHRWADETDKAYSDVIRKIRELNRTSKANNIKITPLNIVDAMVQELGQSVGHRNTFPFTPSTSTVRRRLREDFTYWELYANRYGEKAANKKVSVWNPRDKATSPLEVVEFDDKDSRVYLVDEQTFLPYGRAFVTSGVDQYTKVPLGFSISENHRDTLSAKEAFINSVLPFDTSKPEFADVQSEMPYHGYFGKAIFDNAMYNHAKGLEVFILEVAPRTEIGWAAPYKPTEKSVVEQFNSVMSESLFSHMSGFGGPKDAKFQEKRAEESSSMLISEFRKKFMEWVYDEYCLVPQSDGYTPFQRWQTGTYGSIPRVPAIPLAGMLAMTKEKRLKLRREGISNLGLHYLNPTVEMWRKKYRSDKTFSVRYNPHDLSFIFIQNPDNDQYLVVPSTNPTYTKQLTEYQHKLIVKSMGEMKKKNPSIIALNEARAKLAQESKKMLFSKKKRYRFSARKTLLQGPSLVNGESDFGRKLEHPSLEIISEIEAVVDEINAIELDPNNAPDWDSIF